jgi:hypothetical protein
VYVNRCCIEKVILTVSVKEINFNATFRRKYVTGQMNVCCFIAEWKIWGHPVCYTAVHRNYEWRIVNIYFACFEGSQLGSMSDIYQPKIFHTLTICGDTIAIHLPRCTTGIDGRYSP